MGAKLKELMKSRKFWGAVIGAAAIAFHDVLGIPAGTTESIGNVIMGWLLAQGAVDVAKQIK